MKVSSILKEFLILFSAICLISFLTSNEVFQSNYVYKIIAILFFSIILAIRNKKNRK